MTAHQIMIPGTDHLTVLGPQRVLDIAAPIIKEKLLKPLGLEPYPAPIRERHLDLMHQQVITGVRVLGQTNYTNVDPRPTGIWLVDPFEMIDNRPGGTTLPTADYVGVLTHELLHASLWRNVEENEAHNGHGPTFKHYMELIGLTEPTLEGGHNGPKFAEWYRTNLLPVLDEAAQREMK